MTLDVWQTRFDAARKGDEAENRPPDHKESMLAAAHKDLCDEITATASDWRALVRFGRKQGTPTLLLLAAVRARAMAATLAGSEAAATANLDALLDSDREPGQAPEPVSFRKVPKKRPTPILSVACSKSGAMLTDGSVLMLAGEGGIGKSALAAQIAHGVAMGSAKKSIGGMFDVKQHGPVLYAAFEDQLADVTEIIEWHCRQPSHGDVADVQHDVLMHDLSEHPLYGPPDRDGVPGFYTQRPDRMPGWHLLWHAAQEAKPTLIVIDSATDAYVGNPNDVAPVATFIAALRAAARKVAWPCGILLLGHSTKAARSSGKGQVKVEFDPFNPGTVAGSAAWTDKARGVLAFQWNKGDGNKAGVRLLSVPKSNYGVARVQCVVTPQREVTGRIMGFEAGKWEGDVLKRKVLDV